MIGQLESPDVLHIPTGVTCNNWCTFCMERSTGYPLKYTLDEYCESLDRYRKQLSHVVFTGGEPTLNPLLRQMIGAARERDFEIIGVISNGRRLQDREYCEALLAAGLTKVTVSLHGPNADVHDWITRRKHAFGQTFRGLRHLAELKPRYGFYFKLNTTIVKGNVHLMREMADIALELGVDNINFNVVEVRGNAIELFDSVVPRYVDVMEQADSSGLDFNDARCSLSRVPACAGGAEWVQETWHVAHRGSVDRYDALAGKTKGPMCEQCWINEYCPGIWDHYVERYGWDEFKPVVDPQLRVGQTLRVFTGSKCNNRCVHCRDGPAALGSFVRPNLMHQLRHGVLEGYRRVELTGGELLLDEGWPRVIRLARDLGFVEVVLETNGRMLSLPITWRQLVKLGLHGVVVRLNAGNEAVHDEMAQVRGAFRQTVRGMLQLRKHGVPFVVRVIEDSRNLDSMGAAEELANKVGAWRFERV